MPIEQDFNDSIVYYDDWMQKALPNFGDIFQTAKEIIPFDPQQPIKVLDLGAGTGLFSKHVFDKYPYAQFVLFDLADKMLEVAQKRFQKYVDRFQYVIGDYRQISTEKKYDLVISSLSIHHLSDPDKKELFARIHGLINKGGVFINVDQIRGETEGLQKLYWTHWLEQVRRSGAPAQQIEESIHRRQAYDQDALLSDQIQWFKDAGFEDVDCVYKNYFVGVFYGIKK